MAHSGIRWWGVVLIIVGALLFVDNYVDFSLTELLRTWWPLVLVIWGVTLILRHGATRREHEAKEPTGASFSQATTGTTSHDDILHSGVFGDTTINVNSQAFKGGTISSVFGDTVIDLSGAALSDGEQVLKINGVFGDTTITLGKDMPFSTKANTVMGDVQVLDLKKEGFGSTITYQVPEYSSAAKKLMIHTSQVFGDILVRR